MPLPELPEAWANETTANATVIYRDGYAAGMRHGTRMVDYWKDRYHIERSLAADLRARADEDRKHAWQDGVWWGTLGTALVGAFIWAVVTLAGAL